MSNDEREIPTLPFDVPSENGRWKTLRRYKAGNLEPPPKFREVKRSGAPNKQPRQSWFEENILRSIARRTGSPHIPWRFKSRDGKAWQLDKGCVGHAFANGVIVKPKNLDKILWSVRINEVSDLFRADAEKEVERQKHLARIARRKQQRVFSTRMRRNYGSRCALTGCSTPEALAAAHIRLQKDADINSDSNGILLRSDIHALFDCYLITLSRDGRTVEASACLTDPEYQFLRGTPVRRPQEGGAPSSRNIEAHRERFLQEESLRSKKSR